MDKLWVVLLATAPFQAFFVWAAWWRAHDLLNDRRTTRAAATAARRSARDSAAGPTCL